MGWDKSATDPLVWAAKMKDVPKDAVKIFAFSVFSRVVERTPVDTGQARSNWLVTVGQEDKETFNKAAVSYKKVKKRKGENAGKIVTKRSVKLGTNLKSMMKQAELEIGFSDYNGDETIYIQNNTPYIRKLEFGGYGKYETKGFGIFKKKKFTASNTYDPSTKSGKTIDGFSRQAPQGMIGVVMAMADRIWDAAVKAATENL